MTDIQQASALYTESKEILKRMALYPAMPITRSAMLLASAQLWERAVQLTPEGMRPKEKPHESQSDIEVPSGVVDYANHANYVDLSAVGRRFGAADPGEN